MSESNSGGHPADIVGVCKMCLKKLSLRHSHIWPAFLYKDYVADLSKGGQFVNVHDQRLADHIQAKRYWFCGGCEQILSASENMAKKLLRAIERQPGISHSYDEHLLRFVTSISWRVALLYEEDSTRTGYIPCRYWRRFLLREWPDTAGFTQHAFVNFDDKLGTHRIIGGGFCQSRALVISQAGPIIIIGWLCYKKIKQSDVKVWEHSEIQRPGGSIRAVEEWKIGEEITADLYKLLLDRQHWMEHSARLLDAKYRKPSGET